MLRALHSANSKNEQTCRSTSSHDKSKGLTSLEKLLANTRTLIIKTVLLLSNITTYNNYDKEEKMKIEPSNQPEVHEQYKYSAVTT